MVALSPTKLWAVPVELDANPDMMLLPLKDGKPFRLIGTVTADEIDFDTSPYVPKDHEMLNSIYAFRNMVLDHNWLFFENPFMHPEKQILPASMYQITKAYKAWQAAENALVKKLVILEKI